MPGPRAGHAALAVIVALLSACGAVLAFVAAAFGPGVEDLDPTSPATLRAAADDAVALAIAGIWGPLETTSGKRGVHLDEGLARLDELGLAIGGPAVDLRHLVDDAAPVRLGDAVLEQLSVVRTQNGRRTFLHLAVAVRPSVAAAPAEGAVARASGSVHAVEHVFELTRAPWDRSGLALAARKFESSPDTRVLIDSAARVANREPELAGSFEGVRAALLGDFVGRHDLTVAGSLFVGGRLLDRSGRERIDPARAGLAAFRLDPDGRVVEREDARDEDGAFLGVERVVVPTFERDVAPAEALYLDQRSSSWWPTAQPNFDELVASIVAPGSLTGTPARLFVAAGSTLTHRDVAGLVDPDARRTEHDGEGARLVGTVDASVVALGVAGDPLLLDGDVIVDGDLVLCGVVRGTGRLFVRGTAYLPSDLSTGGDTVAVIARDSIVIGQPFDDRGAVRPSLARLAGPIDDLVAPSAEWIERPALSHLLDGLLAERARWRALRVESALHAGEAVVVSGASGAVGLDGAVDLVGCLSATRIAVDAPAGLRVLFDPHAPRTLDLLDPQRAILRRLGEPSAPAL